MRLIDADLAKMHFLRKQDYSGALVENILDSQPTIPRLTDELKRLIELGRAVEYATRKHDPAPIVIVSIEGFIGWYRKEAAE